ncbi:G-protein coupled receptor 158, partial [Biomphalaria glabrata]
MWNQLLLQAETSFAFKETPAFPCPRAPLIIFRKVKRGTSGIDIDLQKVDIDQCPGTNAAEENVFANSSKCRHQTTQCEHIPGLGFRRGSYKCVCKPGFYFPYLESSEKYFKGTDVEDENEKKRK